jgi:hypothetical protein
MCPAQVHANVSDEQYHDLILALHNSGASPAAR